MEFTYYSVDVDIKELEVYVLGVKIQYKTFDGFPEFVDGELVAPKYAVINKEQLSDTLKFETGKSKSLKFVNKLSEKIEGILNEQLNK